MSGEVSKKSAGILTVREAVLMPDGGEYRHFWHNDWIEVGGSVVVQMTKLDDKGYKLEPDMMASFPAAQVLGFTVCDDPPTHTPFKATLDRLYIFGGSK